MAEVSFASLHGSALSIERHGQKAALLARAVSFGECVPQGFVLDVHEAARVAASEHELDAALASALERLRSGSASARVAVRSSPRHSLPGALLTQLDVEAELEAVRAAIRVVVASSAAAPALDQLRARGLESPNEPWTAVLVQAYLDPAGESALGAVVCTRDPATGEPRMVGEYVSHAGADCVVSGRSLPMPLSATQARIGTEAQALEHTEPERFAELRALAARLELAFGEPLELELAHAHGLTWLLQVRPLALAPRACARVALEAIQADSPTFRPLLLRVVEALPALVEPRLPPVERVGEARVLARGLAASPGVARGVLMLDVSGAVERSKLEPVVLARRDAIPEDVAAFRASSAVLTTSGGLTSHAAVIARGLRVPAVVGAKDVRVDVRQRVLLDAADPSRVLAREGDLVSVDAHRGLVYRGAVEPEPYVTVPELDRLLEEARKLRRVPGWVRGAPTAALAARELARLDGVLCVLGAESLPAPRGRDTWVEVDVARCPDVLADIPEGYGLVLSGPVTDADIEHARRVARLRPIGVHVVAAPIFSDSVRLDVVWVGEGANASDLEGRAPRVVRMVDFDADASAIGHSAKDTLACAPEHALRLALTLAAVGRIT